MAVDISASRVAGNESKMIIIRLLHCPFLCCDQSTHIRFQQPEQRRVTEFQSNLTKREQIVISSPLFVSN